MTAGRCGGILVLETPLHYIPSFAALGPAADAAEQRENPHRTCHPVGVLLCPHDMVGGLSVTGHRGPRHLVPLLPRRRTSVKSRRRRCISLLTDVRRCGRPALRRRFSLQGGRFYFLPVWQRFPCRSAAGERQRPPCPHSDKSGGEGGTLRLACCTA